jgi:arylsulfatase A-like enzyme
MSPARTQEVIHETLFWRVGPEYAALSGDLKLLSNTRPGAFPWLFDLASDPRETVNQAHVRPEDARKLQERYQQWAQAMKPPAWQPKQIVQIFQCGRISFHEQ